jgi:uncharacterized protein YhfF
VRKAEFAFPGELRDRLVAAVLAGDKTATSTLLVEFELDGEAIASPGDRMTVVDSNDKPVAVTEITGVEVIRMGDADLQLALDEGEGFESVLDWRDAHERFWSSYADELRERLGDPGWTLDQDTPIVVERFKLVERLT